MGFIRAYRGCVFYSLFDGKIVNSHIFVVISYYIAMGHFIHHSDLLKSLLHGQFAMRSIYSCISVWDVYSLHQINKIVMTITLTCVIIMSLIIGYI